MYDRHSQFWNQNYQKTQHGAFLEEIETTESGDWLIGYFLLNILIIRTKSFKNHILCESKDQKSSNEMFINLKIPDQIATFLFPVSKTFD